MKMLCGPASLGLHLATPECAAATPESAHWANEPRESFLCLSNKVLVS